MSTDRNSGRNSFNSGSDSRPHYGSTPIQEYSKSPAIKPLPGHGEAFKQLPDNPNRPPFGSRREPE